MKNHGRYDHTSLEVSADKDLRARLKLRSQALTAARESFLRRGYLEVDTPILRLSEDPTDNPVFSTLGPLGWPRLHFRTCPEEYTRRAAAVFGRAFEIGKSFRNAPIVPDNGPRRHLAEFTLVEFYEHGDTLENAINLLWGILKDIAQDLTSLQISFEGNAVDLSGDYVRLEVLSALEETGNPECHEFVCKHLNSSIHFDRDGESKHLEKLINKYVRPTLVQPTFLSDFPRSADPLPDEHIDNCLQRAELTIGGMEVGEVAVLQTDVNTLNDHVQRAINDRHGETASVYLVDQAYLDEIKELNCKVIGGGFGFDRFLMLLTGVSDIREVVWYPGVSEHVVRRGAP